VMVLYGIAATLFAYCVSLVVSSPLAAFAATAGIEVVMFIVGDLACAGEAWWLTTRADLPGGVPARLDVCKDERREPRDHHHPYVERCAQEDMR
jgi:hypothetical protein